MQGLRVGSFTLERPLAAGGMGEVWRAVHKSGVAVGLKIISAEATDANGLDPIAALQAEIRSIAGLEHPNIVPVYDAGVLGPEHEAMSGGRLVAGSPWLAMELAEGSVRDLVERLDWPQLLRVLLQVLDGLAHAHARGVIHRDLKPGNVLYTRASGRMRILVADFGLAWAWHRAGAPQDGGTVAYAAPEQLLAQVTEQGPWTDLYALGCTAFRMITGRKPFRGSTIEEIRRAHLFSPVPPLRARFPIPDELSTWIDGLMAKDPRQRYQRAADAAFALLSLPQPQDDEVDDEDDIDTVSVFDSGAEGTRTLPVEAWIRKNPTAAAQSLEASHVRPPVPEGWARPRRPSRRVLGGRGLGLFGLGEPPVVGRQAERDALWTGLTTGDRLQLAIIGGAQGMGKTHLASWLCERSHEVGAAEVFRGTFTEEPSESSGLAGLLQEQLRTHGMSGVDLVRHLRTTLRAEGLQSDDAPTALARLLRPADPSLGTSAMGPEERVSLAWEVMRVRTHGRRLLVFLDDAHLSSDAGALLLHVAKEADAPGLIVLTMGPDVPPTLREQVQEAEEQLPLVRVPIGPLDPGEAAALVQAMLPVPDRLAERIAAASEGSPLATVQLVADLVQRGQLRGDASGVEVDPRVPLPDSIGSLWEGALERVLVLQPEGRAALDVAALLGSTVALPEWRDAAQRLGTTLDPQRLARMVEHGFVVPARGGGRYSFTHAVLRDALVEAVTREGRAEGVHLAIGDVLESRGDARAAQCGQHLEAANEPSRAADAYLRAMRWVAEWDRERALELGARWYATLGKAASDSDARWAEGMQVLVELLGVLGGDAHRRAIEELLERGKGDPQAETRALIELCRADLRALALTRAHARAELAWRRCPGTGLQTQVAAVRAEVRRYKGELSTAEELLRTALEDDPDAPPLLLALSRVLCDAGRAEEALDLVQTWADRLTRAQAPMARARIQRARGIALHTMGHPKRAVAALEEARQMRDRAGFDWPALDLDLAVALYTAGDEGQARDLLQGLLGRLDPERDARLRADALAMVAEIEASIGSWDNLEHCIDAIEDLPEAGRRPSTAQRMARVAERAEALGEVALARRARRQAGA